MTKINFLFNRDETLGAGVTDTSSNNPNAKKVLENQEGCGFRASEGTRSEFFSEIEWYFVTLDVTFFFSFLVSQYLFHRKIVLHLRINCQWVVLCQIICD